MQSHKRRSLIGTLSKFFTGLSLFGILCLTATSAHSQPITKADTFSRQGLFERAYSSLGYFLNCAEATSDFSTELSSDEKLMLGEISKIAVSLRNRQWLKENKVESFMTAGKENYYYTFMGSLSGGSEIALPIAIEATADLIFSDDQSIFQLDPNEPTRSAMTETDPNKPIYVNLEKINNPDTPVDITDAVQILVHEMGHKLGPRKKQASVDSLAAKVKVFLQSKMSIKNLKAGQVSILNLPFKNYNDWFEVTLSGRYQGVNIPNRVENLKIFSREGFYAFFTGSNGAYDLTESIINAAENFSSLKLDKNPYYDWKSLSAYRSSDVNILQNPDGSFRIDANLTSIHLPLPFLNTSSPDPRSYQPWKRYNMSHENSYQFLERTSLEFSQNLGVPKIQSIWKYNSSKEVLEVIPRVIQKYETADHMNLVIEISGKKLDSLKYTPFLTISNDKGEFQVAGAWHKESQILTFSVSKNIDSANSEQKLRNVLFAPSQEDVTNYIDEPTLKTFFENTETILTSPRPTEMPVILNATSADDGKTLVLRINSGEKLMSLKLLQQFSTVAKYQTEMTDASSTRISEPGFRELPGFSKIITVTASQMIQNLNGNILEVQVDVSKNLNTFYKTSTDMTPTDLPPYMTGGLKIVEHLEVSTLPKGQVLSIEIQTDSLKKARHSFPKPINVDINRRTHGPSCIGLHSL